MIIHKSDNGLHLSFDMRKQTDRNEVNRMLYLFGCYGPFLNYKPLFEKLAKEMEDASDPVS